MQFKYLEPVYSLNLVNDIYEPELEEFYHYYRMVHVEHSDRVIEGLHLVFVELPKFTPHTFTEKKMQALWLRYLTEISSNSRTVPADLLDVPEINKAVQVLEESAYNDAELYSYDKFWDMIRVENALFDEGFGKGMQQGREQGILQGREEGILQGREQGILQGREEGREEGILQGREEGREEGRKEGRKLERIETARNLKKLNIATLTIAQATGLSPEEISAL